jgi:hypothetical protein
VANARDDSQYFAVPVHVSKGVTIYRPHHDAHTPRHGSAIHSGGIRLFDGTCSQLERSQPEATVNAVCAGMIFVLAPMFA